MIPWHDLSEEDLKDAEQSKERWAIFLFPRGKKKASQRPKLLILSGANLTAVSEFKGGGQRHLRLGYNEPTSCGNIRIAEAYV